MKKIVAKSNNRKLPTLCIAVCALNEESNIGNLLESIITQKEEGYKLKKILAISDGSTDNTVATVKKFASRKLVLKSYKKRMGKSYRLNEIFAAHESDILVITDADVIFSHPLVVSELIKPLVKSKNVRLTGGNPTPMKAITFTEKAIQCTLNAYIPLRKVLKGGNNAFSATGRLMGIRKELAAKIHEPSDTISNDGYIYFSCLINNFQYRYVEKAHVTFRSPQSLSDQIKQSSRFAATYERMKMYFPHDLVDREYYIPSDLLMRQMLKQFVKHPILCTYIFVVNKYCHLRALILKTKINAIWDLVYTTKRLN